MAVTKEELFERTTALLPGIAARAVESEQQRRPHDDSIRELIDAGVMQTLVPKRFGGHELGLDALAGIGRLVASACVSTGWVTAFYLGHNWMLAKFSEQVQAEVFAERSFALIPIQPSPNVDVKKVSGGYEISARQNFGSGIMHADWVIVAKTVGDHALSFVVPRSEVEVDDVWFMSGMAGTGSNDVLVNEVFVPEHRSLPTASLFGGGNAVHDNPMYSIPLLPFIYCEVMGVYTGGLEGATEAYDSWVQHKRSTWGGELLATKQATHINLGAAHARARAARLLLDSLVEDTRDISEHGEFTLDVRLDLKLRAGYIADLCRQGVNEIMSRAGTRNFQIEAPLQRYFRDINTIATHAFLDWEVCRELYGRNRLGLEPNSALL